MKVMGMGAIRFALGKTIRVGGKTIVWKLQLIQATPRGC
jgi:hypothetical protein